MQFGKKSKSGLRVFIRNDGMIVSDKKGRARIVIGVLGDDKHALRSGRPSTFKQLGCA
ncbi:TPA: hypothetical protein LXQ86_003151 [Salmonella enterica subsp. enterica serovar Kentucky]|jgi:hypothetical protein|nr:MULTISPECIES: hypothetical protein [Enterobacteriaceae]EDQ1002479.1 hypothetical protein [Salmonella enterica subsp. enterica serovar Mbandaka]EDT2167712.1 hypothetical protein [Salmonella enterica subsp. enterica]EEG0865152.1 hypothetical protein [Salmonella enterica subsp. enterica serovar Litchfield]MCU3628197.1 hypothetical protein [Enterobacter hormaechei subsp. steigerwaltii]HCB1436318.1 hypothetical protein [Citrobacter braakii]